MAEKLTLEITTMAHGGSGLGRDAGNRVIFVPYTIPGETVEVRVTNDKKRFANALPEAVLSPSPDRTEPRCPHFGVCGGCHLQHIDYERQLELKQKVLIDQLARLGGLKNPAVRPVWPNPDRYAGGLDIVLSPLPDGGAGLWSDVRHAVMPIEICHLVIPELQELIPDLDIALPTLRKITLRAGSDGEVLAALETTDIEPPEIEVDFPVSLALVLPDGTAANLIGDATISREVKGRVFRISAGAYFYASPPAAEAVVDAVLRFAGLDGSQRILELYSGVGMLTAFLAAKCDELLAVESNPDAVADMATNLGDLDNVAVYEAAVEDILPEIGVTPDVVVADPGGDLPDALFAFLEEHGSRFISISHDVAGLARDAKTMLGLGYRMEAVQPIDMWPQTYQTLSVALWLP